MSERILTREEVDHQIRMFGSSPLHATILALYDSQAADRERIAALEKALAQIRDQEPQPFDFPKDWSEQIAACLECKRYKGHPIQQGICNQHRKPLYAREAHDSFERKAMGYRAASIARAALQPTPPQEGDG